MEKLNVQDAIESVAAGAVGGGFMYLWKQFYSKPKIDWWLRWNLWHIWELENMPRDLSRGR